MSEKAAKLFSMFVTGMALIVMLNTAYEKYIDPKASGICLDMLVMGLVFYIFSLAMSDK